MLRPPQARHAPGPDPRSALARGRRFRRARPSPGPRCQARRSGSDCGSVASASARCATRRSCGGAARYDADRTSGCRKLTRSPIASNPAVSAGPTASVAIPSRSAARHSSVGSPIGSAAAMSNNRWVSGGSSSIRRRKPSSIRPDSSDTSSTPNPPASSAGVRLRGSSSNASGLPRVSATIRSRTCASSGPLITEPSSSRASPSRRPLTFSSGSLANSSLGSRVATMTTTGSASSRS